MHPTDKFAGRKSKQNINELQSNAETGLSSREVAKRLQQYGYNEIPEKEESTFHRVFRRFWGPIPGMIEVAALLSAVVRRWEDFTIIEIHISRPGRVSYVYVMDIYHEAEDKCGVHYLMRSFRERFKHIYERVVIAPLNSIIWPSDISGV